MSTEQIQLFTTAQAAEYLNKSESTIKRAVRDGLLIGRLLNPRMRVFTKDELDTYAQIKRKPGKQKKATE